LLSNDHREGLAILLKGCYTLSIDNKEREKIMFTFEKKLKKLQELAPEYAKNLLTEDQKDAFEETALTWGYTIDELIEPYYKTVTFTDLAAETKMNNQLITMYQ
jgi:hypothetical protein|tara:strand:- start:18 stop:329 length:312 start_codon:yes stop_codon:yes gene_type:complete